MRNGRTEVRIWVARLLAATSVKTSDFCRIPMLVSVSQPVERNSLVLPLSPTSVGSFISPVMTNQSRPPDGSGLILPSATLPATAASTTS